LEDLILDGGEILKYFLKESFGRMWTGFKWLRTGTSLSDVMDTIINMQYS
jgi:hypothetical protein